MANKFSTNEAVNHILIPDGVESDLEDENEEEEIL